MFFWCFNFLLDKYIKFGERESKNRFFGTSFERKKEQKRKETERQTDGQNGDIFTSVKVSHLLVAGLVAFGLLERDLRSQLLGLVNTRAGGEIGLDYAALVAGARRRRRQWVDERAAYVKEARIAGHIVAHRVILDLQLQYTQKRKMFNSKCFLLAPKNKHSKNINNRFYLVKKAQLVQLLHGCLFRI